MSEQMPDFVKQEMREGREGVSRQILDALRDATKDEPLLESKHDTVSVDIDNDPTAENNKKAVDAAFNRLSIGLEAEGFALKHLHGGFDDRSVWDSWRVVRKPKE